MATLSENINQAISDFDGIKNAIEDRGVEVTNGTRTSDYPDLIRDILNLQDILAHDEIYTVKGSASIAEALSAGTYRINAGSLSSLELDMPDNASIGNYNWSCLVTKPSTGSSQDVQQILFAHGTSSDSCAVFLRTSVNGSFSCGFVRIFPAVVDTANITNSAVALEKIASSAMESTPTFGSAKLITSGAVYNVNDLLSAVDGELGDYKETTNISGSSYTWERKTVNASGYVSSQTYSLLSPFISTGKNRVIKFTGSTELHGKTCLVYVCQYSSGADSGFIKRDWLYLDPVIYGGCRRTLLLDSNCKYVKFVYMHRSADSTEMPTSSKEYFTAALSYLKDYDSQLSAVDERLDDLEGFKSCHLTKTTVSGSSYTWENKNLDSTGREGGTVNTCILSPYIAVGDNKEIVFTGSTVLHSTDCIVYVYQFSANNVNGYIKRELAYAASTGNKTVTLDSGCNYVRFTYSHANASGVAMPTESKANFSAVMQYPKDYSTPISEMESKLNILDGVIFNHISKTYISGGDYTWENKNVYVDTGLPTGTMNTCLLSPYISVGSNKEIIFTGSTVLHSTDCIVYVYQYSNNSGTGYIGRSLAYAKSTGRLTVKLDAGCTYVRFTYSHLRASETAMPIGSEDNFNCLMIVSDIESGDKIIPLGLHTMPENEGTLNLIKRCRQLTDIKWTPAVDLPRLNMVSHNSDESGSSEYYEGVFKQGVEYTGIPYGRCVTYKQTEYGKDTTYVGLETGFDTFITSVSNPDSMVCKESVFDLSDHRSIPYAAVCSALTCYALNVPYVNTANIPNISGLSKVADIVSEGARIDLDLIKLGDVLNEQAYHTAMITDIVRDNGKVLFIEICEATVVGNGNQAEEGGQYGGLCRRTGMTVEEFFRRYGNYELLRYSNISSIPYTKSPYVNVGDELDFKPGMAKKLSFVEFSASVFLVVLAILYLFTDLMK